MYFLNGGVGTLEALRKPLCVTKASYERAQANLAPQPMADRMDPARKQVWFRTKQELYVPYWTLPEYQERMQRDPMSAKSDLIYQPYWMTNKSRARLIQRPSLQIKPKSEVLVHLGTDEDDGLGKGFNPIKAITKPFKKVFKAVMKPIKKIIPEKALFNIATGGLYSVAKAGINIAKGKPILKELKGAIASQGIVGSILTPKVGVDKSLMIQGIVAGGALTAAGVAAGGGAGLVMKGAGTLLPKVTAAPAAQSPGFVPDTPFLTYDGGAGPGPMPQQWGTDAFGPPLGVAQAGMFGSLSPLTIGLLIGVPLLFSLLTKSKGRR